MVTAVLVLVGLWLGRKRMASRLVGMVAIALFVASFRMPNGWSLWKGVHDFIPGAGGLRAVGRIALIMLLPASIGLAGALERISRSAGMLAMLLVGLEQGGNLPTFDKGSFRKHVQDLTAHIQPDCKFFLFSPGPDWTPVLAHTVAIWAVNRTGVPTLNAASGGDPPSWKFADSRILADTDRVRLRSGLDQWNAVHREPRSVCWIQASGDGSLRTERVEFGE